MIKASLVLAAAFCLTLVLRKRAAAERHIVWASAIISAAVLPVLSLLLPSWQPALAHRLAAALPAISSSITNPNVSGDANVMFHTDGIEPANMPRVWPIVWAIGSAVGLFILGAGIIQQRRFARRSVDVSDPVLTEIAADLARRGGCRRTIHLRQSLDQPMPMTWGILRPEILFPNCVDQWSDERKRVVIAHELAHVRRLDYFFQTIAQIACAVYWFNPLFWIACNRLYRESEHACDDIVINLGTDAREYASHLLGIARDLRNSGPVCTTTLAMARQSTLEKRFEALLRSKPNRTAVSGKTVLWAAMIAICLVLPLAAMRVSATLETVPKLGADLNTTNTDSAVPKVDQYTTPPLYSDEGQARGIEGIVTLEARVGSDGRVKRLRVVKGLGYGLDENALLAVRDWRFVPARRNGIPIEATTQIDVEFNLKNAELNEEIANDMATRIGPGVTPPQVVHRLEPQYSARSALERRAGAVVLDAVILEDGSPKIVRVIRSLDWGLDEIAINALKQWRFSPAMKDGQAVKVRMNIAVTFSGA
jgi:TonB family protein